jgi:hypothetical protein
MSAAMSGKLIATGSSRDGTQGYRHLSAAPATSRNQSASFAPSCSRLVTFQEAPIRQGEASLTAIVRDAARHQRSGEQPVLSTGGPRPDLLLVEVVVDGQRRIMQVARERGPALEAVVDRPGGGGGVVDS